MAKQILGQEKNSILGNRGITQPQTPQLVVSKLHNEYSINGNPRIPNKPSPSKLDDRSVHKIMAKQILGQEKNSILGNGGITQPQTPQLVVSKLHNEYSINGNPNQKGKPNPSSLDENDIMNTSRYRSTSGNKYTDNLPK